MEHGHVAGRERTARRADAAGADFGAVRRHLEDRVARADEPQRRARGHVADRVNLFWSPVADVAARALFPANGTLAAWRRGNASAPGGRDDAPPFRWAGGDRRSRVADPLFADVANGVLEPASPAFALGFAALPDFERLVPPKETRDAPW